MILAQSESLPKGKLSRMSAALTSEHQIHHPVHNAQAEIKEQTEVTGDLKGLGNLNAIVVGKTQ